MTERLDAFTNVIISNNSEARSLYDQTYPNIFYTSNLIMWFSACLIFLGIVITIVGLSMNLESVSKPSTVPAQTKSTRLKFSWRSELKELWVVWNGLIAELFLIVASIIVGSYLATKGISFWWAVLLIVGALSIRKSIE